MTYTDEICQYNPVLNRNKVKRTLEQERYGRPYAEIELLKQPKEITTMEKFNIKQFEKEADLWQKVNPTPIPRARYEESKKTSHRVDTWQTTKPLR